MNEWLKFEKEGHIVTLTMNRPEIRNPLGESDDVKNFEEASSLINNDRDVRCVILTGVGAAFSAGGNVKNMKEKKGNFSGSSVALRERYRYGIHRIVRSVWNIEVPVIAAVNGAAIGLGNDVACLADIRIASKNARFGVTFLKIGLIPGDGGAWLLPKIIGLSMASELLFTGKLINADQAKECGLISKVFEESELMIEANNLAQSIVKQPPDALRMSKKLLREGMISNFETILEMSANMQALMHLTEDHQEAITAFFEKRDGDFKGK
ncbi:MAG: enoyl-CoA hydratase [Rhodobiaceae bacterium]|jgi:enoyl-CoA hydratase/carnithine racemase|nr:enoyl-CoA hydratase [Rhodobiaceae bacterium]|tara:strand:+ start:3390 stop:4190 length:801 start_codon:yes stop_codon:yes gene_type:complete